MIPLTFQILGPNNGERECAGEFLPLDCRALGIGIDENPRRRRRWLRWPIPAYLFTGGVAGASSMLALGGRATGDRRLARQSRLVSVAALGLSTYFLIEDLGKPARFYNMLRVFKPTSPMNMGSWLLSAFGVAAGTGVASDLLGVLPALGAAADATAGVLGPALATFTAVLIADTAVPAWHEARHELPFVFASGAAASAGGIAVALAPRQANGPGLRMLAGGAVAEMVAMQALRRRLGPELATAYEAGRAGRLGRWAKALTIGGAATAILGRRQRLLAVAGGLATATGAALERFAIIQAGTASTVDPRYVVEPQRRRLDAAGGRPPEPREAQRSDRP